MVDISHDDGLAEPDPGDLHAECHELVLQAQALTHLLKNLVETGDGQETDPNDSRSLKQRQYASIRILEMYMAEAEALSKAIDEAQRSGSNGGRHG